MYLEVFQHAWQFAGQLVIIGLPKCLVLRGGEFGENSDGSCGSISRVIDRRVQQRSAKVLEAIALCVGLYFGCGCADEAVG